MSTSDLENEKAHLEKDLKIQRKIAIASELFQREVTVRAFLESLAEGVVVIDTSGTILLVNNRTVQMFGYSSTELLGMPHSVLVPERFRKTHEEHEAHYFQEPRIRPMGQLLELAGRRRDGSEFPVEISLGFIETINGLLILALVSDMTLRKQFESHLLESEELFHIQVEGVKDYAVFMLDAQGNVLNWNTGAERLEGYRPEEIIGRHFSCFYSEEERNAGKPEAELTKAAAEGLVEYEGYCIRKDGGCFWADVIITALRDEKGKLLRFSIVIHDITERKSLEDQLLKTSIQNELILASAGEGIIGLDLDGNQTFVNTAAAAMLGYDVNELVGKQSHSTWHYAWPDGSFYPVEKCPVYAAYRDGTVHSGEEMFLRKDGTSFQVHFSSRPIFSDGKISGAVLTFNNITERKRMEEELRESEERFRATFEQAAMGIAHAGPDGRLLRVNRKYCDILGYSEEELKALTIHEITHPDDREENIHHFQQTLEGKLGSYSLEKRYVRKDGSIVWVNLSVSTVVDTGGNLKFAAGVIEDISARKMAEKEIERLNMSLAARAVDLEDANRELETFNYTVAHDLRNPLNVISSYCQAIKELCGNRLDEQCEHYLQATYDGTKRMNRLIEALLSFSHLTHIKPNREQVDLSAMSHEVATELKLAGPERCVTFRITDGVHADGDANLLRMVLANLLGNAYKYTATREEAIIEFGVTEIDGKTVYFVRDNGSGFNMADADKLFAPFQRLPGSEGCKGFGVGLATVERIIRRHGGRIWAEGEPDKGATFYFSL